MRRDAQARGGLGASFWVGGILLSPDNSVHPTKGWEMLSTRFSYGETEEGGFWVVCSPPLGLQLVEPEKFER